MTGLIDVIRNTTFLEANSIIRQISGIVNYFSSETDKEEFITAHREDYNFISEDRVSYGDWQTPISLAKEVCKDHLMKYGNPDVVIEPTCGLGAFLVAALEIFTNLSKIYAVEINQQYVIQLKYRLLLNALNAPLHKKKPDIYIFNADFFGFDFSPIVKQCESNNWALAVIGNPPWVTNSRQSKNNSKNIPKKSNDYGLKGIDAITGKSNFDISEFITLHILKQTQNIKGGISFLLKNSVIRSILLKQNTESIRIGNIEQQSIDASSEFDVSVDASCFSAQFDCIPSLRCRITNFYTHSFIRSYGGVNSSFVSDIALYHSVAKYDSSSDWVWRSGIKHDCASVLELTLSDGVYYNGLGECVTIEDDLIFPLLKSSDINNYKDGTFRKFLIVPQRRIGEPTDHFKYTHPLTYSYLLNHEDAFAGRKSSIYKGKDRFSIFGVGDYTFKPYKILVSSLYKTIKFVMVSQFGGKPIMVDDTCYQLDFDDYEEANKVYDAVNSQEIQDLLKSLVFTDAKRVITKSLLMRLNLSLVCKDKGVILNSAKRDNLNQQLSLFDSI